MIGMWKAFAELEEWMDRSQRPKMIAVQAEGCAIVRAWEQNAEVSEFWQGAATLASGLRVPKAVGDYLILQAVRASGGTAVAVSDNEMLDAGEELASLEELFLWRRRGCVHCRIEKTGSDPASFITTSESSSMTLAQDTNIRRPGRSATSARRRVTFPAIIVVS
jgi:hypothetical protein